MYKKQIFIFYIIFLSIFCFADNNNKKPVDIEFNYETELRINLIDKLDGRDQIDVYLDKNSPEKIEELSLFFKINNDRFKRLIIGPYFNSEFRLRFDHKRKDRIIFLERLKGFTETGINLGYKFKKKKFKGSKFIFSFPVFIKYNNYIDANEKNIFPGSFYIGTKPGLYLNLNIRKAYTKFGFENYITFAQNVIPGYREDNDKGFYFEQENEIEIEVAPFNFISKKVDLWLIINNNFIISYNTIDIGVKYKLYLGLEWKGFKYLYLGWNYFVYRSEIKIPEYNRRDAYDQLHFISMEIWAKARYKFFSFLIEYRAPLFVLDRIWINNDSVKPHSLIISLEFKI